MNDAPERIWAWFFKGSMRDGVVQGGWDNKPDRKTTEYVRADLLDAVVKAAVEAERETLLAVALRCKARDMGEIKDAGREYCKGVSDVCRALGDAIRARGET